MDYHNQKSDQKSAITFAREAVVRAEDARVIALRRQRDEAVEIERHAGLARENAERARADDEARRRAQAEADRLSAERVSASAQAAAQVAEHQKLEAEIAKEDADRARVAAENASRAAVAQQQQLAVDANRLRQDADRRRAEEAQAQLRRQLRAELHSILETRDSPQGLIVTIPDALFETGRSYLKPETRDKLARVATMILRHPGLRIRVEGHTDNAAREEDNMRLSQSRASSVRSDLVERGIDPGNITAQGFGSMRSLAANSTAAGRQMNRRVELVVSGDILGTPPYTRN